MTFDYSTQCGYNLLKYHKSKTDALCACIWSFHNELAKFKQFLLVLLADANASIFNGEAEPLVIQLISL